MICITGVPGTGKTTISRILNDMGYRICDAAGIAGNSDCISGTDVDLDCLMERGDFSDCDGVQSHFSHLLQCSVVFILEADEEELGQRMRDRGYTEEKISENIDAQRSDTIYYEALDRVPSNRIFRLKTTGTTPESVADNITQLLQLDRKK